MAKKSCYRSKENICTGRSLCCWRIRDRLLNALTEIDEIAGKEFTNFGLREYPECGTPLEVLEFHKLDGKSIAQRISGVTDIETEEKVKQKYTADAPQ